MLWIRRISLLLLLVIGTTASGAPRVGEAFPDITLPNIKDGKPVSLSSFRGKKVLLVQFASW